MKMDELAERNIRKQVEGVGYLKPPKMKGK